MALVIKIFDSVASLEALRTAWDGFVKRDAGALRGHDITSGFVWFEAMLAAFPEVKGARVVAVQDGEAIVALLPVVSRGSRSIIRQLLVPTTLYGGRNGFLLSEVNVNLVLALLGGLGRAFGHWQSVHMTIVANSDSDRLINEICETSSYNIVRDLGDQSPHFPLLSDAETFAAKMSKGLKQTLRTSANKFRSLGRLEYREVVEESQAEAAITAILKVDRASWKHSAGTAITSQPQQERFYRSLFPRALRAGILYGQILYLENLPIAFNFGLIHCGVFCCLKHSQTVDFESLSASQLVNASMIAKLRAMGVTTYDFMGKPEPHKFRWSDATALYERRRVWIYNASPSGWLAFKLHGVKNKLKRKLAMLNFELSRSRGKNGGL